ncbi:MAG: cysteine peptidase family C39 domain-containing protein, partial [Candidatus Omnitrophica bacterium]|nr:cysteine peptidase family C39 domain-containing protein [Candidatus Omnitrophota bacterium]
MIDKGLKEPEPESELIEQQPEFRSTFKTWIKIVAFVVVAVFLPEQVAWAIEYNPAILWRQLNPVSIPSLRGTSEAIPNPVVFNKAVAQSIYRFLKPLVDKPIEQVQIRPGLVINVALSNNREPLTANRLKSIYDWLKKPETETVPCSAYVLYNLLKEKGIDVNIVELSSLLILIDILVGNINAEGLARKVPTTNTRIYNSLYALEKTAAYFGLNLYATKLSDLTPNTYNLTPFIAHLRTTNKEQRTTNAGHFVLVTKISDEKVEYFYDKGSTFLPRKKFLEDFSGYCLVSTITDNRQPITEIESQSILGAKREYLGYKIDWDEVLPEPSWSDIAIAGLVTVVNGLTQLAIPMPASTSIWQLAGQTIASYTIQKIGENSGWNPYLTSGLSALGSSMVGSAFSPDIKWSSPGALTRFGNEFLKNTAVVGSVTAIKWYGAEHGWKGFFEDLVALGVATGLNYGITAAMNSNYKHVGPLPETGIIDMYGNKVEISGVAPGTDLWWDTTIGKAVTADQLPLPPLKLGDGKFLEADGFCSGAWEGLKNQFWSNSSKYYLLSQGIRLGFEFLAKDKGEFDSRVISSFGLGLASGIEKNPTLWQGILSGTVQGLASYGLAKLTKDSRYAITADFGAMLAGSLISSAFDTNNDFWGTFKDTLMKGITSVGKNSIATALGWNVNELDQAGFPIAGVLSPQGISQQIDYFKTAQLYGNKQAYMNLVQSNLHYKAVDSFSSALSGPALYGVGLVDTYRGNFRDLATGELVEGMYRKGKDGKLFDHSKDNIQYTEDVKNRQTISASEYLTDAAGTQIVKFTPYKDGRPEESIFLLSPQDPSHLDPKGLEIYGKLSENGIFDATLMRPEVGSDVYNNMRNSLPENVRM